MAELEEQRAERDADMARRLQQQYDTEYYREQADENMAKQLDRGNNPNGAHPPSTSLPPDYGLLERERERERERGGGGRGRETGREIGRGRGRGRGICV